MDYCVKASIPLQAGLTLNQRLWHQHRLISKTCRVSYQEMPEQMCFLTIDVLFQLELTLLAASVCTLIALARVSLGRQRLVLLVSCAYDHRWLLTGLSESCWLMAGESDGHMRRVVYQGLVRCFRIMSVLIVFWSQGTVLDLLFCLLLSLL